MNPGSKDIGNAEDDLRKLNEELGEKEKAGDRADKFFQDHIAEDLIFRRANGVVTDKEGFLSSLKPDQFDRLETSVDAIDIKVAPPDPNMPAKELSAVVDVTVIAQRKGTDAGKFRNIRMFHKREGEEWKLRAWINTRVPDLNSST